MTTSFQAPTGENGGAAQPTSFAAPGVAAAAAGAPDDKTVVFEHGGRKFTAADLAKKIDSADGFIDTLKQESAQTRALLEKANEALGKTVGAAELLAQLRATGALPAVAAPAAVAAAAVAEPAKAVTAEEVAALVLKQQSATAQATQADANWQTVTTTLTTAFGTKTDGIVAKRAAENGLTLEAAAALAKSAPKAFLALFPELKAAPPASPLTRSSVNSQAFAADVSAATAKSSGYATAKGQKAQTATYLNRLTELGF